MMVAALGAYLTDVGTGLAIALYGFGQHTYVCMEAILLLDESLQASPTYKYAKK